MNTLQITWENQYCIDTYIQYQYVLVEHTINIDIFIPSNNVILSIAKSFKLELRWLPEDLQQ